MLRKISSWGLVAQFQGAFWPAVWGKESALNSWIIGNWCCSRGYLLDEMFSFLKNSLKFLFFLNNYKEKMSFTVNKFGVNKLFTLYFISTAASSRCKVKVSIIYNPIKPNNILVKEISNIPNPLSLKLKMIVI